MKKQQPKPTVYDERCGNCYYNEERLCDRNPATCPYNKKPVSKESAQEVKDND